LLYAFSQTRLYFPVLAYAPLPFLVWAALRLRPLGTATAIFLVAFVSMVSARGGAGIFGSGSVLLTILSLQLFLLAVSIPLLSLSIIFDERKRADSALRNSEGSAVWRLAFESLLSELSRVFINLPEKHVHANIEAGLARIGTFLRLDRIA